MKRFSLREILLLFVIVGLALGWWNDRRLSTVRYQIWHNADENFKGLYVLDTVTGEVREARTGKYVDSKTGEVKEIK
jgi:hypothetical protein